MNTIKTACTCETCQDETTSFDLWHIHQLKAHEDKLAREAEEAMHASIGYPSGWRVPA